MSGGFEFYKPECRTGAYRPNFSSTRPPRIYAETSTEPSVFSQKPEPKVDTGIKF